ncbi:Uncharacterised protein [BD1-7 clade bacterium]|nr:Uncharacterised protein [BD1-7 clade bacterium]
MLELFTERLRDAIETSRYTKTNIALILDVTPATVSGWLNGKHPKLSNLIGLCQLLNVSLNWLISGIGDKHYKGMLHVTETEGELVSTLRVLPGHSRETLMDFLSWSAGFNASYQLDRHAIADDMLKQSRLALIVLSRDGVVSDINVSALDILNLKGHQKAAVIGTQAIDWLMPSYRAGLLMAMNTARCSLESIDIRCDLIRYGDDHSVSVQLYANYDGALGGFFTVALFPVQC